MGASNVSIENMLFYMIAVLPAYLILRLILLTVRNTKINWYHEAALLLLVLFAAGTVSQTILPDVALGADVQTGVHKTNLIPFRIIWTTYQKAVANGTPHTFLFNFFGNLLLFLPVGFFLPLLWHLKGKTVILIGFLSSLSIEICQLFLTRYSDIDDVILNTVGVILGLLIFRLLNLLCIKTTEKFKNHPS